MNQDTQPLISLPTAVAHNPLHTAALALWPHRLPGQSAASDHAHPPVRSLYIHIPFCSHKCHYCDFYSFVDTRNQQAQFVETLLAELRALAPHAQNPDGSRVPLRTIFIGGGTPSLLAPKLWKQLLTSLAACFDLSLMGQTSGGSSGVLDAGEFTVECNPESTTPELLALLRVGGVNRVSMGAQSFNPRHLKTLERLHQPENVSKVVQMAREAGIARQSIDLIYAIPGQTIDEWHDDLRQALALQTTHLSCYNLIYEPNTAMAVRLKRGEFVPVDEDTEAAMFELTDAMLSAAGLRRYEVSNYSMPGHESLHNLAYWRHEQWLAAGPSASGHVYAGPPTGACTPGYRWKNVGNLGTYLSLDLTKSGGYAPITDLELPDPKRVISEVLMMGLRTAEGVDWTQTDGAGVAAAIEAVCSPEAKQRLRTTLAQLQADGLVKIDQGRLMLTDSGWLLTDWVVKQLMPG